MSREGTPAAEIQGARCGIGDLIVRLMASREFAYRDTDSSVWLGPVPEQFG
jgi:hypothetical protein